PETFLWQGTAFGLFRYFDITKPQPARYFDQHVKNGFGVMADDLVAAGYTLLCLALLRTVLTANSSKGLGLSGWF
ncbi:MAG: phosphatidylglycerophosphatase A, partial [Dechloromonas sp.]|nr:phosphatidylglycerophosphatase A [Candidatus Dechloromonas phosphorivorans]